MLKVVCNQCNKEYCKNRFLTHYNKCILKNSNLTGYIVKFLSRSDITNELYYIYASIGTKCEFSNIDKFLRETWCECCGHLSTFTDDDDNELPKSKKIEECNVGDIFLYEYDMGTTTMISMEIIGKFNENDSNESEINIINRNLPPIVKCYNCKEDATLYNSETDKIICKECRIKLRLKRNKFIMNIVNSPRTCMCGYE
jgi:hypothetical protein